MAAVLRHAGCASRAQRGTLRSIGRCRVRGEQSLAALGIGRSGPRDAPPTERRHAHRASRPRPRHHRRRHPPPRPRPQRAHRRDRRRQVDAGRRARAAARRAGGERQRAARRRQGDRRGRVRGARRAPPGARVEALGLDVEDGARRRPARGLGRGPLARLGERQPDHRRGPRPSSARCWWTSTASTRPSRCCTPTPSATSSTPSRTRRPSARRWPRRTRRSPRSAREEAVAGAAGGTKCAAGPTTCATWCDEIEQARLKPGEDEALQIEARRLSQAGALGEQAQRIVDALEGEAGNALGALGAGRPRARARWRRPIPPWPAGARCWTRRTPISASSPGRPRSTPARSRRIPSGWPRWSGGATCSSGSPGSTAPRIEAVLATARRAAAELDLLDTADVDLRALGRPPRGRGVRAPGRGRGAHRQADGRPPTGWRAGSTGCSPSSGCRAASCSVALAPLAEPGAARRRRACSFDVQLNVGLEAKPLARVASGGELVAAHARAQGGAGAARRDRDAGLRRGGSGDRRRGRRAGGRGAGRGGGAAPGAGDHPPAADRRPGRPASGRVARRRAAASPPATCSRSTGRIG